MFTNKRYTISQVVNGFIVTPDFKEKLDRDDLRVFNKFEDMMLYIKDKFEEDTNKLALDAVADEITEEDHQKLKEAKKDMSWMDESMWKLECNARISYCLQRRGIVTIKDLLAYTDKQLMKLQGIGKKSINDIRGRLQVYQYKWEEEHA